MPTPRELLDRLETRHDELLRKLDELNLQIEETLVQFGKARQASSGPAEVVAAPVALPVEEVTAPRRPRRRAA